MYIPFYATPSRFFFTSHSQQVCVPTPTATKPASDLAVLGKTSPHHQAGRGRAGQGGAGLPKCIRLSPISPLFDPFYHFQGRIRGKAGGTPSSGPVISFAFCACFAAKFLLERSGLFQETSLPSTPSWPLHWSSGHVPGVLASRPKPCFVHRTPRGKSNTSSRAGRAAGDNHWA